MKVKTTAQIARWYDLPGTRGDKKWIDFEDAEKEIKHLRGKIEKIVYEPCDVCKRKLKFLEKYDSFYCPGCLRWVELICGSKDCKYFQN